MLNCVFCKIISGESPCYEVYADECVVAFLAVAPLIAGHTLVVPREHHNSCTTLDETTCGRMMERGSKIGAVLIRAGSAESFMLLMSNGKNAGQVIPHIYLNVIPRHGQDGLIFPEHCVEYTEKEKAELQTKIKAKLHQRDERRI